MDQMLENSKFSAKEHDDRPCIFKIPLIFRTVSVYEYTYRPCRVAIGPYHAQNNDFKPMQKYKSEFVKKILSLAKNDFKPELNSEHISRARKYYAEIEDLMDDESFTQMLIIDGLFVVGFLMNNSCLESEIHPKLHDSEITARETKEILRDFMLLENQLPFFILEIWYRCLTQCPDHDISMPLSYIAYNAFRILAPIRRGQLSDLDKDDMENIYNVIEYLGSGEHETNSDAPAQTSKQDLDNNKDRTKNEIKHLLHLILLCYCPPMTKPSDKTNKPNQVLYPVDSCQPFKTLTELHEAGVQFKMIHDGSDRFNSSEDKRLLVKFNDGVLKIPRLTVDEFSESFFRNIIAFEQYYLDTFEMASYIYLMDHLIDTSNDVKILQEHDLIENWLESKDNMTKLFNSISRHAIYHFDPNLQRVSEEMKKYVRRPCNRWKAKLRRDYFGTPWAPISFIAALIVLGLTIIQTLSGGRQINWKLF